MGINQTNCYLLGKKDGEIIIVDPGAEPNKILRLAQTAGKVIQIVNTHGHFDHIGGNEYIKEQTSCELLIYREERELLRDPKKNLSGYLGTANIVSPPADRLLEENDVIHAGEKEFRVLHTPGHSMGGACFYCEEEGILLSGDTIFKSGVGRTDFPGCSRKKLMNSIKTKLLSLPGRTQVLPGHGEKTTIQEFKVKTWEKMY
ncbi:MAG: MBL fold metallo-hydrolase [Halanaerobiaceae bacterium]